MKWFSYGFVSRDGIHSLLCIVCVTLILKSRCFYFLMQGMLTERMWNQKTSIVHSLQAYILQYVHLICRPSHCVFSRGQRSAFRLSVHMVRTGSSHRSTGAVWTAGLHIRLYCLCVFHMPASRTHPPILSYPTSLSQSHSQVMKIKRTWRDFVWNNPVEWDGANDTPDKRVGEWWLMYVVGTVWRSEIHLITHSDDRVPLLGFGEIARAGNWNSGYFTVDCGNIQ